MSEPMRYVQTRRFDAPFDVNRCAAAVHVAEECDFHQCTRRRRRQSDGGEWCGQHNPSRRAADAKRRAEKRDGPS